MRCWFFLLSFLPAFAIKANINSKDVPPHQFDVEEFCTYAASDPLYQFLQKKSQKETCRQVLSWLEQQEMLDISNQYSAQNFNVLAFAFNLKWLVASRTGINDLNTIAHLPLLLLDVSFTPLQTISVLPKTLKVLDISNTPVNSLKSLEQGARLLVVDAYNTKVTSADLKSFKKTFRGLINPHWNIYGIDEEGANDKLRALVANCKEPGMYSLTFDDGPSEHTDKVLDILAAENIKATFFVVGSRLANSPKYRETLARTFREGHSIGNHTWSHPLLTMLKPEALKKQIEMTDEIIKKTIGIQPEYFRPPYGAITQRQRELIDRLGHRIVLWDSDSIDYVTALGRDTIFYILYKETMKSDPTKESYISLEHDTHLVTLETLSQFIQLIRNKGYRIVPLPECI